MGRMVKGTTGEKTEYERKLNKMINFLLKLLQE
jgi:hypothetical protein